MTEYYTLSPHTSFSTHLSDYFRLLLTFICCVSISPPNQWFSDFDFYERYISGPHLQSFRINSQGWDPRIFISQIPRWCKSHIRTTAANHPLHQSLLSQRCGNATPFAKTFLDYYCLESKNPHSSEVKAFTIWLLPIFRFNYFIRLRLVLCQEL